MDTRKKWKTDLCNAFYRWWIHLLMTAPQPVLGFLPSFSFNVMGREVGAQQIVGIGLLTCGVCCLVACRGSPVANMMDM